ncbi:hypothetical protein IAT40_007220 [Kwoniella sp. CBS 6097]
MRPFPPPPPSFLSASSTSSTSSTSTSSMTTTSPTIRPSIVRDIASSLIGASENKNRDKEAPTPLPKSQPRPLLIPQQPRSQPQRLLQSQAQAQIHSQAQSHQRPHSPAKTKSRRPTSAFDNLFADILDALASSGLETDHPTQGTSRARTTSRHRSTVRLHTRPDTELDGPVRVQVHGELKKLKHSISERNLSNSAKYKTDIQLLDRLILAHRAEQLEMSDLKAELAAERELTRSLQFKLAEQGAKHAEEVDGMGKANRRALKVLLELQKEEYVSWAREVLEPNMEIIELGVRRRIANWERGKRERMVLKRQSSQVRNRIPRSHSQTYDLGEERQQVHPFARQSAMVQTQAHNESSPEEKGKSSRPVTAISVGGGGGGGLVRRRSSVRGSWATRKGSVRIKVEGTRGGAAVGGGSGSGSLRYRERASERDRDRVGQKQAEIHREQANEEWEDGGHPFVHALCKFLPRHLTFYSPWND